MEEISTENNILITGGTSGLGLELVKLFLNRGYTVIVTGRQSISIPGYENKLKIFRVDFSDLNQVALTAKKISEDFDINLIINNAGILSPPEFTSTVDGFEYTFQVNFLSHLLINEIILCDIKDDRLIKTATVISPVYRLADPDLKIPSGKHDYSALKAYSSSKLFLTLMCEFLPASFPGLNLKCFSFDPGTFSSGIYRMQKKWFRGMYRIASPFMRKPGKVAEILAEILIKDEAGNGAIYDIRKCIRPNPVIDEHEKEAFRRKCYEILEPFISS
jgi:NAD(P)-dependent dehydrogenase (short-subunit alcohol dehydrogenase family)